MPGFWLSPLALAVAAAAMASTPVAPDPEMAGGADVGAATRAGLLEVDDLVGAVVGVAPPEHEVVDSTVSSTGSRARPVAVACQRLGAFRGWSMRLRMTAPDRVDIGRIPYKPERDAADREPPLTGRPGPAGVLSALSGQGRRTADSAVSMERRRSFAL